jgi:hypothetical protein
VSVLLNTTAAAAATPTFATQQTFAVVSNPISVALADLNGDGRPDLAVANNNPNTNTVSVLLNTTAAAAAKPSFASQLIFAVRSQPFSVAVGDLNGDSRPDLAVANYDRSNSPSPGFVSVLLNNSKQALLTTATATGTILPAINLPGSISGTVFQDININGVQNPGEPGLAGQTLFLDLSGSGKLVAADPTTTTDSSGKYQFSGVSTGTYTVRQVLLGGMLLGTPASGSYQVTVTSGSNVTGQNFAEVPTSIAVPLTLPPSTSFLKQGNANANFVEALYRAILNRDAEPGGLASWTNVLNSNALSRLQVAQAIRKSPEHFTGEVTAFYFTLLGRAPDPQGLQGWVQNLQNGLLAEEQIAFAFLDSPEYLSKGDKYFVDQMYISLLGRSFDSSGEASWLDVLGNDASGKPTHAASMTHEQVITQFLRSDESLNRLVQGFYQVFLQRLADPGGLSGWLASLKQGGSFLTIGQQFLSSTEFYNRAAAQG